MIFKEIRIKNLFSYYGEQIINLTGQSEDKNIVLISGRNGVGKTSFINSLKLLFLGTTKELRSFLLGGRLLTESQYICGYSDEWDGIFNHLAKKNGETECSIQITWEEDLGNVIVRRLIRLLPVYGTFEQKLIVKVNGRLLGDEQEDDEPEDFLKKRLPDEYVPFFFYDGELVQQIAESRNDEQLKQTERLLGISNIDILIEYLKKVEHSWKKDAMDQEVRHKMDEQTREKDRIESDKKVIRACPITYNP
jgi:DNA sulfur modification protein DndD